MSGFIRDLISQVRAYAVEHYDTDGMDYVVEAMDDDYIAEKIQGCRTAEQAIETIRATTKIWAELDKEHRDAAEFYRNYVPT